MKTANGFRPVFAFATEFVNDDNGICVKVFKSNHRAPEYRIQVCSLVQNRAKPGEEFISPYVSVRIPNRASLNPVTGDEIAITSKLMADAEMWIQTDAASVADKWQQDREQRERAELNKDKPVTRVTGKTAKKKEKLLGVRKEMA